MEKRGKGSKDSRCIKGVQFKDVDFEKEERRITKEFNKAISGLSLLL